MGKGMGPWDRGRNGNKRQEGNGFESEDDKRDECAVVTGDYLLNKQSL